MKSLLYFILKSVYKACLHGEILFLLCEEKEAEII